jgi:DNA-binding NarL/FixJ family response regulator
VLRTEPGLVLVGAAADPDGAPAEARRTHPDVALVAYSAFADAALGLPAAIASGSAAATIPGT